MQNKVAEELRRQLRSYERARARSELLLQQNGLRKSDVLFVYDALLLRSVCAFEAFLEKLFVSILLDKCSYAKSRVTPRVTFSSSRVLWAVLLGGQDYLQWLPYDRTVKRAESFLRGGRPFTQLGATQIDDLRNAYRVRNAVAHPSSHAQRVFHEKVLAGLTLPPRERTTAGFLRSVVRINPRIRRLQIYMRMLDSTARALV